MGRRGPHTKPTALKILTGNPGKRPLNDREPLPKRGRPKCPAFLHPYAKEEWSARLPELDRLQLMTVVDRAMFAAYCQAWAEFRIATETLNREGRTTTTASGGIKPHPAKQQQDAAIRQIRDLAARFGLDPSSRAGLRVPEQAADDPLAAFLNPEVKEQ